MGGNGGLAFTLARRERKGGLCDGGWSVCGGGRGGEEVMRGGIA